MKKYTCTVCGYIRFIADGSEAPDKCYTCHAPADKFKVDVEAEAEDTSKSEKPDTSDAENGIVKVVGKEVARAEGDTELADKYYDAGEYDKALPIYKTNGLRESRALFRIGRIYAKGLGVKVNSREGAVWYEKAADMGNADAQYNLALLYYNGKLGKKDFRTAFKWFYKCAESGDAGAQFFVGAMYYAGEGTEQNYQKAVQWYQKAIEQGDAGAMYCLGTMYYDGDGIDGDKETGIALIKRAAASGDEDAQKWLDKNVGNREENGGGEGLLSNTFNAIEVAVEVAHEEAKGFGRQALEHFKKGEFKEALPLFLKAAELGKDGTACGMLGTMYQNGFGTSADPEKAFYWYEKAAIAGNATGYASLGHCYKMGFGTTQDYKKALYWYEKSLESGNEFANMNLGLAYINGEGVEKDEAKGFALLMKVACLDSVTGENASHYAACGGAQSMVGTCYRFGIGTEKNITEALKWFKRAIENGDPAEEEFAAVQAELGAQDKITAAYKKMAEASKARDEEGDYKKSLRLYMEALEMTDDPQCNGVAENDIAHFYYNGLGFPQDKKKGLYWLRRAAKNGSEYAIKSLEDAGISYS